MIHRRPLFSLFTPRLWSRITKNTDWSTGPLARPFACSLAPLTHLLALHCLLCSHVPLAHTTALIHSLTRSLTHSQNSRKVNCKISKSGCSEPSLALHWASYLVTHRPVFFLPSCSLLSSALCIGDFHANEHQGEHNFIPELFTINSMRNKMC